MAILTVHETIDARKFDLGPNGERTYERVFRVTTDAKTVGSLEVYFASGVPRMWDYYLCENEYDYGARVVKVQPKQTADPFTWLVTIQYSSGRVSPQQAKVGASPAKGSQPQQQDDTDPFARPPEIRWGFSQYQRVVTKDTTGKAIVNSANDAFDPPPTVDDSRPTLTYVRNLIDPTFSPELVGTYPAWDPALAIAYQDAVNTDTFLGVPAGQAKVASLSASSVYERGIFYYKGNFEIHFRREGWALQILDQGYHELDTVTGKYKIIVDALTSIPKSSPTPLNGNGFAVDFNSLGAVPHYLTFKVYKELPFSALPIV